MKWTNKNYSLDLMSKNVIFFIMNRLVISGKHQSIKIGRIAPESKSTIWLIDLVNVQVNK